MQFSEAWLRSLVDPGLDTAKLCHLLTMAGLEVEAAVPAAPPFSEVVVGEILAAERHPDADRLQVCRVDVGAGEPLQIVCGAGNARAGLRTACARVDAVLPGDFCIRAARVRGVESFGMLCSAKELGLADAAEGIIELPADASPGADLRGYLDLDDQILTLKLTPNRGDCLSLLGVAREVAAISGAPLTAIDTPPVPAATATTWGVRLEAGAACPVYCGRVIEGLDATATTPEWMVRRLQRSGLRAIHPVVDVTNYVLLELGEPMHAFDLAHLDGDIRVRLAAPGERLTLLNDQMVEPDGDTLVIADASGPVALAGIMGGVASAVSAASRDIFLEAAHFTPAAMAGKARRHGLNTDSSHRFERGVDPGLPVVAMERATRLILDICGGRPGPVVVSGPGAGARAAIDFRPERARRLLGTATADGEMRDLLRRLALEVEDASAVWRVRPPGYRFDLALEVDLIEEVARLGGYDAIPAVVPRAGIAMRPLPDRERAADEVMNFMVSRGYQEIVTYSFISDEEASWVAPGDRRITLLNPIANQLAVMRSSLLPGLLQCLRRNLNHGQDRARLIEIGRCFAGAAPEQQPLRLGGLGYGPVHPEQWGEGARETDFFDLKADIEALLGPLAADYVADSHPALHPGQCARLVVDGQSIGWLGALHPRLTQELGLSRAPVLFELNWAALVARPLPRYHGVSRFPAVRRDIAVVVDAGIAVGSVLAAVRAHLPELVTDFALFDVYQGRGIDPGKKSLAFRMLLQHTEKTLIESEIEAAVSQLVAFLSERFGASLRG